MTALEFRNLCVELQCRGVRMNAETAGRSGGAGPAEGRTIIIGGRYLTVPTSSWYVAHSPFHIACLNTAWRLYREETSVLDIAFPAEPRFYSQATSAGLSYQQLALLHGKDCFASTVFQDCKFWDTPLQCRFCGIGLSLKSSKTILKKEPADLAQAASFAALHDGARHVTLTSGAWKDEQSGLEHMCSCVSEIKKAAALPVHVQVHSAENPNAYSLLKAAGADTLGIHIEVCSDRLLATCAPGKAQLGLDVYTDCWTRAAGVFGKNQVSTFLITGCGETADEFTCMTEHIARLGVFPFVLPLRPIPHTPFADLRPPEAACMEETYMKAALILKKYGLSSRSSKAGCVRCGACSCLQLFEETAS